mmetsp:Transcript_2414/g.8389  ORF Transcript_2414/g.8389 Transcript_2414/m.8389 type:complete len:164 (+) Transcript_2414:284-775(+)
MACINDHDTGSRSSMEDEDEDYVEYHCDMCGVVPITVCRWHCEDCQVYDVCDSCYRKLPMMREKGYIDPRPHTAQHTMKRYEITDPPPPLEKGPLSEVVNNAVRRWFRDTARVAKNGDIHQSAMLGQMLSEGYGCTKNDAKAAEWTKLAKKRGHRMDGVYCAI